jgi:hypothetical protein
MQNAPKLPTALGVMFFAAAVVFLLKPNVIHVLLISARRPLTIEERKNVRSELLRMVFYWGAGVFPVIIGLFSDWYAGKAKEVMTNIVTWLGPIRSRMVAALTALVLGQLASLFKQHDQYRYGFVEVAFGTVCGGVVTAYVGLDNFYSAAATYIGCVYVVARGFNNIVDGGPKKQARRELAEQKEKLRASHQLDA